MQHLLALSISAFTIVFTACDRGESAAPAPPASIEPVVHAAPRAPAAPAPDGIKQIDPSKDVRGLIGRLEHEAAHRPRIDLTADQVFDALAQQGIVLDQRRQYLGAIANASYCAGGTTSGGVAISVCEYADAAAARDGKRLMDSRYAAMAKHATRIVHGATLLTIVPPVAQAQGDIVARATQTFAAL